MAGKVMNLVNRNGRYFSRLVIPEALQVAYGKTEDRIPLGADYREATKKHHGAMAILHERLAVVKNKVEAHTGQGISAGSYPLSHEQIALRSYQSRLKFDQEMRDDGPRWANSGSIDDMLVAKLRDGMAGKLSDDELSEIVGPRIERYRFLGNTTAHIGSSEWRELAHALCVSEYEVLSRVDERDEGEFGGVPTHPLLLNVEPIPEESPPLPLKMLFQDYVKHRQKEGAGVSIAKRWPPVFDNLVEFLGHNDARRITQSDLKKWRTALLDRLTPKTINGVYLAGIRAVLNWAVDQEFLDKNPASEVHQKVPKVQSGREKGFTLEEALNILRASRDYAPKTRPDGGIWEYPKMTAAKKWVPIICAHTGARVSEITQLRKQDFRTEGDIVIMRITPDAGSVKAGNYRDVPLHRQLISLGLPNFIAGAKDGPLFYRTGPGHRSETPWEGVSGRLSEWLNSLGVIPDKVSPSHGWRHRYSTVSDEIGIAARVKMAILGHAGRTAGDDYGDITVKARQAALAKMPCYEI